MRRELPAGISTDRVSIFGLILNQVLVLNRNLYCHSLSFPLVDQKNKLWEEKATLRLEAYGQL